MLDNITVREWMSSPVLTVSASLPIAQASQLMRERGIRRLPVFDGDELVGIITEGDVREARPSDATSLSIWELNYLWAQLTVEKIMSRNVITVYPDTTIIEAASLMLERKIGGLPVVDHQRRVVGILTESDVFKMLVKSRTKALMVVES